MGAPHRGSAWFRPILPASRSATEIPPRDLFSSAHRRLVLNIYTAAELVALPKATDDLIPINGLRIAEALALTRADVDPASGVLCIEGDKFHQ